MWSERYRRLGADPPFGDPAGHHGVPMEGYYWRLVDPASGRVVVALCGVVRGAAGTPERALVALSDGSGPVRHRWVEREVRADPGRLALDAGGVLRADRSRLSVDLGPGARLQVDLIRGRAWPRPALGALGLAQMLPGLQQYWHAHTLGGAADGRLESEDGPVVLAGAVVYGEKNWGRGFPPAWWWGQAGVWDGDDDACVAFAGGRLGAVPGLCATTVVVRLGDEVIRLVAPAAVVRARAGGGEWHVRASGPRARVDIEARAGERPPLALPFPPREGEPPGTVAQFQHGHMTVVVRRGRRVLWRGESRHAALERGERTGG
ncbi:MAG: tocopherol cyclase family protein [Miltoncostaeaceae bacterium]